MTSSENYGEKAGDGIKGIFRGINDVGEGLRKNINGFLDSGGDAVASRNGTHRETDAHNTESFHDAPREEPVVPESRTSTTVPESHTSTTVPESHSPAVPPRSHSPTTASGTQSAHPDADRYRHGLNSGIDSAGKKLDGWMARHGHGHH